MPSEDKDRPADESPKTQPATAGKSGISPAKVFTFFAIAICGCAADLWTKSWAFATLGMPGTGKTIWVWQDVFGFRTNLNFGALFGIGQGRVDLFVVAAIIAAIGVPLWFFIGRPRRDWTLTVALGMIMAGIGGNLYDRIGLAGEAMDRGVRDWIHVMIGDYAWPTFNIADSMLVCGAILLIFHAIFLDRPEKPSVEESK